MASVQSNAFFLYNPADASRPENEHVLVGVKIQPSASPDLTRRRPFHLALVLDTSGSMEGQRMTALSRTLHLLIDELYRHDRLTIVEYNNMARILAVDIVVSNEGRTQLHTIVNGLVADGGTNLEAAFGELYRIVQNPAVTPIDSVFILTDGHINNGMTNSPLLPCCSHFSMV
jgi:Mg-chelatase subunit ChlD